VLFNANLAEYLGQGGIVVTLGDNVVVDNGRGSMIPGSRG